jgi:hypothetical protein
MEKQYHEIITHAQTGEVTEIIRDWTPEELAQQAAAKATVEAAKPTVSDLQAQLADIASQLQALQGSK